MNNPMLDEVGAMYRLGRERTPREEAAFKLASSTKDHHISVDAETKTVSITLLDHIERNNMVRDLKDHVRFLCSMLQTARSQVNALADSCESYTLGVTHGIAMVCDDMDWLADNWDKQAIGLRAADMQRTLDYAAVLRSGAKMIRQKHGIAKGGGNDKAADDGLGQVRAEAAE